MSKLLTKPHFLAMNPRKFVIARAVPPCPYLDTVCENDTHNNVFYIYYLGNYDNIPVYHYGNTSDISSVELRIKKTLPFYERVTCVPIGHHVIGVDVVTNYITQNATPASINLPRVQEWNAFTTEDLPSVLSLIETTFESI